MTRFIKIFSIILTIVVAHAEEPENTLSKHGAILNVSQAKCIVDDLWRQSFCQRNETSSVQKLVSGFRDLITTLRQEDHKSRAEQAYLLWLSGRTHGFDTHNASQADWHAQNSLRDIMAHHMAKDLSEGQTSNTMCAADAMFATDYSQDELGRFIDAQDTLLLESIENSMDLSLLSFIRNKFNRQDIEIERITEFTQLSRLSTWRAFLSEASSSSIVIEKYAESKSLILASICISNLIGGELERDLIQTAATRLFHLDQQKTTLRPHFLVLLMQAMWYASENRNVWSIADAILCSIRTKEGELFQQIEEFQKYYCGVISPINITDIIGLIKQRIFMHPVWPVPEWLQSNPIYKQNMQGQAKLTLPITWEAYIIDLLHAEAPPIGTARYGEGWQPYWKIVLKQKYEEPLKTQHEDGYTAYTVRPFNQQSLEGAAFTPSVILVPDAQKKKQWVEALQFMRTVSCAAVKHLEELDSNDPQSIHVAGTIAKSMNNIYSILKSLQENNHILRHEMHLFFMFTSFAISRMKGSDLPLMQKIGEEMFMPIRNWMLEYLPFEPIFRYIIPMKTTDYRGAWGFFQEEFDSCYIRSSEGCIKFDILFKCDKAGINRHAMQEVHKTTGGVLDLSFSALQNEFGIANLNANGREDGMNWLPFTAQMVETWKAAQCFVREISQCSNSLWNQHNKEALGKLNRLLNVKMAEAKRCREQALRSSSSDDKSPQSTPKQSPPPEAAVATPPKKERKTPPPKENQSRKQTHPERMKEEARKEEAAREEAEIAAQKKAKKTERQDEQTKRAAELQAKRAHDTKCQAMVAEALVKRAEKSWIDQAFETSQTMLPSAELVPAHLLEGDPQFNDVVSSLKSYGVTVLKHVHANEKGVAMWKGVDGTDVMVWFDHPHGAQLKKGACAGWCVSLKKALRESGKLSSNSIDHHA